MINPFNAQLNSRITQVKLEAARDELLKPNGRFSEALESLVEIVRSSTDKHGNQTGHGVDALEVVKQRLHLPSINPEQVQKEIAIRLADASNEAKDLSLRIQKGDINTPQRESEISADMAETTIVS